MFGMSFVELAIVAIVALLLLGPDQLPGVARTIGKGLRDLRRASDDLKQTFEQEMVKLETEVQKPPRAPPAPAASSAVVEVLPSSSIGVSPSKPAELSARAEGGIAAVYALDQARQAQALPAAPSAAPIDPGALRAQARAAAAPLDPGAARAAARYAASAPPPVRATHFDSTSLLADDEGNLLPAVAVPAAPAVDAAPSVPAAPAIAAAPALPSEDEFTPLRAAGGPAVSAPTAPPAGSVSLEKKSDAS